MYALNVQKEHLVLKEESEIFLNVMNAPLAEFAKMKGTLMYPFQPTVQMEVYVHQGQGLDRP
jgi:hypothetical protein